MIAYKVFSHLVFVSDYQKELSERRSREESETSLLYPLASEVEKPVPAGEDFAGETSYSSPPVRRHIPTGWSIQIVSASVFQLNGFNTHDPLLRTWIGPFCAMLTSVAVSRQDSRYAPLWIGRACQTILDYMSFGGSRQLTEGS